MERRCRCLVACLAGSPKTPRTGIRGGSALLGLLLHVGLRSVAQPGTRCGGCGLRSAAKAAGARRPSRRGRPDRPWCRAAGSRRTWPATRRGSRRSAPSPPLPAPAAARAGHGGRHSRGPTAHAAGALDAFHSLGTHPRPSRAASGEARAARRASPVPASLAPPPPPPRPPPRPAWTAQRPAWTAQRPVRPGLCAPRPTASSAPRLHPRCIPDCIPDCIRCCIRPSSTCTTSASDACCCWASVRKRCACSSNVADSRWVARSTSSFSAALLASGREEGLPAPPISTCGEESRGTIRRLCVPAAPPPPGPPPP